MKALIAIVCLKVLTCNYTIAQNLFPNPGFEEVNNCPNSYSGINNNHCKDWSCIAGSPDYYNCSFYGSTGNIHGVPSSGNGVVGMWGLINNLFCDGALQRESISANLIEPLERCKRYRVTFDIRLEKTANASLPGYGHDCLDFGFYFYNGRDPNTCPNSCGCWNVEPQVSVSSSLIPLDNYITFSFEFIAQGNFDQVAIGPFCKEKMGLPECYASPSNHGPFQLYFNLDNIVLEKVEGSDQIDVSKNEICQNDTIFLYDRSIDAVLNWDWIIPGAIQNSVNGRVVSFSFPSPGIYSVELITQSNCGKDTIVLANDITVHPSYGTHELDTSITICTDYLFNYPNSNSNLKYMWSDNFIGPERNFESSGVYEVIIQDDFGCFSDTSTIFLERFNEMIIFPNPTNSIWYSKNTLPLPNTIKLVDVLGRVLHTEQNVEQLEIDTRKLSISSGNYVLIIEASNCTKTEKLIYIGE